MNVVRGYAVAIGAIGFVTAAGAKQAAVATANEARSQPDPRIIRVLGARQIVQGAVLYAHPTKRAITVGVLVDSSHALSMVALAAALPRYRRPALTSALVATLAAGYGLIVRPSRMNYKESQGR